MPQLDKFTFAPQVLWLIVIFFLIYLTLVRTGLPRLYKILVFRKKKISFLKTTSVKLVEESFFYKVGLDNFLSSVIFKLKSLPETSFKLVEGILELESAKEVSYRDKVKPVVSIGHGVQYSADRMDSSVMLNQFEKK